MQFPQSGQWTQSRNGRSAAPTPGRGLSLGWAQQTWRAVSSAGGLRWQFAGAELRQGKEGGRLELRPALSTLRASERPLIPDKTQQGRPTPEEETGVRTPWVL